MRWSAVLLYKIEMARTCVQYFETARISMKVVQIRDVKNTKRLRLKMFYSRIDKTDPLKLLRN